MEILMKKWKILIVVIIGLFLLKNIAHYGFIVYENQNFNQMFGFGLGSIVFGYVYYLISKIFINEDFF